MVRRAVLDALKKLESQKSHQLPDFSNPVAAARAWADAKESEQKAALALEAAKPAVEFVDSYVKSEGNKGFRQVAKLLKINEKAFRQYLIDNKIMYRLGGEWVAYQNHIDAGRFYVSTGTANDHAYTSHKFTPKGIKWIAEQLGSE